jgi:hypothetical protein
MVVLSFRFDMYSSLKAVFLIRIQSGQYPVFVSESGFGIRIRFLNPDPVTDPGGQK